MKDKMGYLQQTPINKVPEKRSSEMMVYSQLIARLRRLSNNISELTGASPDWQSDYILDPHHIQGRIGNLYLDPFNIILITRQERDIQEGKVKGHKYSEEMLLTHIRPVRIKQGFIPKDPLDRVCYNIH